MVVCLSLNASSQFLIDMIDTTKAEGKGLYMLYNSHDHLVISGYMQPQFQWAQEKGQDRLYGHFHGVESVRDIVEGCAELGVGYLTLYAFSTENWDRPAFEVTGLMELLVETIRKETETLNKNNIKLHVIGDMNMLPANAQNALNESLAITQKKYGIEPGNGFKL